MKIQHILFVVFASWISESCGWTAGSLTAPSSGAFRGRMGRFGRVIMAADSTAIATKRFIMDEMRPYAMKLHSRDQASEGKQEAKTPFTQWQPTRQGYLQFLVDSRLVYLTLEKIVDEVSALETLRNTGLERSAALEQDIAWLIDYDDSLQLPEPGDFGKQYAEELERVAGESVPRFINHFYNHYFAHTAGGRMIGKKMAEMLLGGEKLKFYQWEGDVKELLAETTMKIDDIAESWSREEKDECLSETQNAFRLGGSLLGYLRS